MALITGVVVCTSCAHVFTPSLQRALTTTWHALSAPLVLMLFCAAVSHWQDMCPLLRGTAIKHFLVCVTEHFDYSARSLTPAVPRPQCPTYHVRSKCSVRILRDTSMLQGHNLASHTNAETPPLALLTHFKTCSCEDPCRSATNNSFLASVMLGATSFFFMSILRVASSSNVANGHNISPCTMTDTSSSHVKNPDRELFPLKKTLTPSWPCPRTWVNFSLLLKRLTGLKAMANDTELHSTPTRCTEKRPGKQNHLQVVAWRDREANWLHTDQMKTPEIQ